jgi:POT family proton-dependent oligopeptide transporter
MTEEVILEEHKDDGFPDQGFNGHPKGLMTLFFSEMWERFCYYGMRVLLTLYLVKSLMMGDAQAALIYGAYTGLVYAAPILGGRMADKFLGYRYAVMLGAVLMAIGEFLILGGTQHWMLIGMGALIVGNGYFKANISTIVGKLYKDNDPRRDSGFTIFYIGINIGALLATTVVAYVGETYGFDKGFALAGVGMLTGLLIFWTGRDKYAAAPGLELREAGKKKMLGPFNGAQVVTVGSLILVPIAYFLIMQNSWLDYILLGLFVYVSYSLITAGSKEDNEKGTGIWRDRMIALIIFMVINIAFWACFEQAGTSLTLFADRNVDRTIFDWTMPASMTQFFNPFFIIVFGSIFSVMWVKLSKIGKNPSIPMKFALGILQLGLGFLVTQVGLQFVNEAAQVPLLTLVFLYLLHTTGELFLSPIGLSMVTKLSPKNIAGTAMGAWFLSFAIANYVGGKIATLTGGHGDDGAALSATEGLEKYTGVFANIGFVLLAIAVIIAVFNKPLKKLMHGVE